MSTRRARIKAVTALPPRRKNVDKKAQEQNEIVKTPKALKSVPPSPSKPLPSPSRALPSPARSLHSRKSPRTAIKTPDRSLPTERRVLTPIPVERGRCTPNIDHVLNRKPDFFVSPQVRASPLRRRSPAVRTPVVEVDIGVERLITPHGLQDVVPEKKIETVLQKRNIPSTPTTAYNKDSGNITDDDNPPSVSTDTDDVVDGIIPLQQVSKTPKPIDLLKNEIISENAEVFFDPIVPLPSPSKVRPKLRPIPRLYPMRRNSVQGSASESEDESRRALHATTPVPARQRHDSHSTHHSIPNRDVNRVRNDSVCSTVSQATSQATAAVGSPLKEKNYGNTKSRRQEVSRRMAALHRRKEAVKPDTLTMYDLIFYNPVSNPIIPDQDEIKAKEASKKEESERQNDADNESSNDKTDTAPVPQIKIGPNGEIVLDEQSLVINRSMATMRGGVVREGAWGAGPSQAYRRGRRSADWPDAETVRFYRALAALGTDFMLMQKLFPGRTRKDLKLKFKKEEKINPAQVDKALRSLVTWDVTRLETEFEEERKQAEEDARKERERLKREKQAEKERQRTMRELKVRKSKGSKALETSIIPQSFAKDNHLIGCTADDLIQQAKNRMTKKRKHKEPESPRTPSVSDSPLPLSVIKQQMQQRNKEANTGISPNKLPMLPASSNIEKGSLVVLTVNDPKSPSKKMLQTYIACGAGELTPVNLPSTLLNSVVGHIKNDRNPSSPLTSPSNDSRTSTPVNLSPSKRSRLSSYTVTQL